MSVEIIAEIGSVHDGSFGNACALIASAHDVGADCVKFQTHIACAETLRDAPSPPYFEGEPRFDYFERTAFDEPQWARLKREADNRGIRFLSSPFSAEAVDLLERIGAEAYKVASGEVTNLPLLERIAATGKPVYVSSGMSSWAELDAAVSVLTDACQVTVLQCSSVYPCPDDAVGLNVLAEMRQRYGLRVGLSDHTPGIGAAVAAVALGAEVIEKHFTFSRKMYGSDAPLALEPAAFAQLVHEVRSVDRMMSSPVEKTDASDYREMKRVFEKSVVTARPVRAGEVLSIEHLAYKKPGTGWPADRYREALGRQVARDLPADHLLSPEDLV
jgi:sialic acid synthase SpsE